MTLDIEKYKNMLGYLLDFCAIITIPIWLPIVMVIVAAKVVFFFMDYILSERQSIFGQQER